MKMSQVQTVASGLQLVFSTLSNIASRKGHSISSVTVSVNESDLNSHLSGNVTVNNRSRRAFKIVKVCGGVQVEFLGVKEKIAA
jgi:hypothetical protein